MIYLLKLEEKKCRTPTTSNKKLLDPYELWNIRLKFNFNSCNIKCRLPLVAGVKALTQHNFSVHLLNFLRCANCILKQSNKIFDFHSSINFFFKVHLVQSNLLVFLLAEFFIVQFLVTFFIFINDIEGVAIR